MIELMQLSEVRVPPGQAPELDAAKDRANDGAAAFVTELDPVLEIEALEVAEVVPDAGGMMVVTLVAGFPDLRIPVESMPEPLAGVLAGDCGEVGFDQPGEVADGLPKQGIAKPVIAADAQMVEDITAARPMETLVDLGFGAGPAATSISVQIPAGLIEIGRQPDFVFKDSSLRMREQGAVLPAPIAEPVIAAVAQDVPDFDGAVPVPVPKAKAESRSAQGPVTPLPAARVDSGMIIVPDAALVVVIPVVAVMAFPLSRQMATEFRWSESVRVERPVVAVPNALEPRIGPDIPFDAAVLERVVWPGGAPLVVAGPVAGPGDPAKAEPGSASVPVVAVKDVSAPGGDLLLVFDSDAFLLDPPPDLTLPSLTPLPDTQQPLPSALRDTPIRNAPDVVTQQVAHLILSHAEDRAELLLEPAELGRLRFEITQRGEGVQIVVMAERPETMDLLRRHADQLLSDLQAMGFSGSALGFGNWNGPPQQTLAPLPDKEMVQMPLSVPMLFPVAPQPRGAVGGLDLRL